MNLQEDSFWERWIFRAFLALLILLPLPLGSNRPWAWGIAEVWIFGLLALWAVGRLLGKDRQEGAMPRGRMAIFLLILGFFYPVIQMIPLPEVLLTPLSPTSVILREAGILPPGAGPISLDPHATGVELLKGLAYLGAFWLTLVLTPTRARLTELVWVVMLSGAFQAVFGILTGDPDPANPVSGTFINRNHLAGFLELTFPVALGLMISWMNGRRNVPETWGETLHAWLKFLTGRRGIVSMLMVSMLLAQFMTQSRSGNACLFVSLLVVTSLSGMRKHKSQREKRLLVPLLLISILAGTWFGLGHLTGRYIETDLKEQGRWGIYAQTVDIIADFPLLGSGAGTFAYTFPLYRDGRLPGSFHDHAHNDHLEILSERGVVGYGLIMAGALICWVMIVRAYLVRKDPFARGLLFASLTATGSLSLHGLTDFNFQIPANAFYFMVLLALGMRGMDVPPPIRKRRSRR
ncbi:MAG: O-antigen ligase family protein [Magnetococcales bacterium]|nr:O-antigen ligase family protein [Magnetococcales bacterium]